MEYINNVAYIMLFTLIILITIFNFVYSYRVRHLSYNLGIKTQGVVKRVVEVNVLLAIFGVTLIILVWGRI